MSEYVWLLLAESSDGYTYADERLLAVYGSEQAAETALAALHHSEEGQYLNLRVERVKLGERRI